MVKCFNNDQFCNDVPIHLESDWFCYTEFPVFLSHIEHKDAQTGFIYYFDVQLFAYTLVENRDLAH